MSVSFVLTTFDPVAYL